MKAFWYGDGEAANAARVVAFPLWRRAGEVDAAARVLAGISNVDARDEFRHGLAARFFSELEKLGLCESEQDEEVGAFFYEVELALQDLFEDALAEVTTGIG